MWTGRGATPSSTRSWNTSGGLRRGSPSGEQARLAAADLGHDWIGTEHTLLGLIRVEESPAARILRGLGFTSDELHETVRTVIAERLAARDER
ncbi:Clp protease N-terminal domain-containing protein [Streptomyces mobaraensis NBRC 13819 = DSM 40847]|uniref:ATPase with chaperone activity, ATP-binding subunit n=1 Tax=Streptomyces mobaraensis (strain ATCC 29032 / DSM 40847 / JCM 4168 / NBRC 13819 / NCIMB 11159 / IPCR 16-22) TaxID=1223523 RepID=M3A8G2_STRM1|nr:Clp protease N-terminal domain-containing protein [Streptomyces mobaraensis]EMF01424.1 ATPase with chaperone activity, ATP-binding subunit [Streptomyces mobaraensis NBRC 13819 = DSM 40847]QTT76759.1 Clp protease N-terminal domain-containing protein [Streptomyces mobaraensis NBRC 13819 = DSM 40847]